MISCKLLGGLGNQLFQIFVTIAYSLKNHHSFLFPNKSNTIGMRNTYWTSFFSSLEHYIVDENQFDETQYQILGCPDFHYVPIQYIPNKNENIMLYGYYQSPKYFEDKKQEIFSLIRLSEKKQLVNEKYQILVKDGPPTVVSLHFRIGDYIYYKKCYPILPIQYYINSIKYIVNSIQEKNITILYFCEEQDIKRVEICISLLKQLFPTISFIRSIDMSDWEEMLTMSLCNHNIIANSTFSWWGAYFNSNEEKLVCYPSLWFGPELKNHITTDLFPEKWKCIHF